MSLKAKLSELAVKAVNEVKDQIAIMVKRKKEGYLYTEMPEDYSLDSRIVQDATSIKAQIDILETKKKALEKKYKPLREMILDSLPGGSKDKVEYMIDGIQVKKFCQIKGAGKLDEDKFLELAKKKKILTKVTKQVRVVDEDRVLLAIANEELTLAEYVDCLSEGSVAEVLKLERKFCPTVEEEDQDQDEAM